MEQEFRESGTRLDVSYDDFIRTTQPRHRAAVQRAGPADCGRRRHLRGAYEGWYCVGCEAFKQEKDLVDGRCPLHGTTSSGSREKNHFFRLSAYRDRLLAALRGAPGISRAGRAAQRDPAPARGGPRGHLDQPRRPGMGHPAAGRSGERRLCVVRRAHQLRLCGRVRRRRGAVRALVAGRPPRDRQGHHPVPHRDLAGDADERRRCRCRGRCSATAS